MSDNKETEADTRANRIDPVLADAGWGKDGSLIRREMICPGRIQSGGKRGKDLAADYVFFYKGQKLAVLEAKRAGLSHREGVTQAKDYAQRLRSRFAYASNGLKWREIDMVSGIEQDIATPFPTPDELWQRTYPTKNQWVENFGDVNFETDGGKWEPRYYQHNAINAALEAVAKGDKRILLTLATGTGKTSIAFQIAWKLFQAKWNMSRVPDRRPRILFLADRNILADQAYNAFSAFPSDAITRIDPETIRKNKGTPPKNASIFFTIFQTFMTGEIDPTYTQYPADFFDFIIIDECHRGGANDESEWRRLLGYFEPAYQLGLTATPKRKNNADTYAYFGEPVYTYALKDGIEDGFLTPFKVRQMASTIDEYVFDGSDEVVQGEVEVGQGFNENDFNTRFIIEERELSRVKEFMGQIDQRQKTLVFCATQEHAALVRDLINQVKDRNNADYCHRVTANDGAIGEQHLRDFQDNDKTIPTVLTTSQKLSTGVDARNVRHIVLMRPVKSMIEFKQIIGRGTRTFDGKDFFTIWDFVKAHENFQDPDWDGEPLAPTPSNGSSNSSTQDSPDQSDQAGDNEPSDGDDDTGVDGSPDKIIVKLSDGKTRAIQYIASTTYWLNGDIISPHDFLQRLFGDLSQRFADEDALRTVWSHPENRERFLQQLADQGYERDRLDDMRHLVDAVDSDLFDVLGYILFTNQPKTRAERAEQASNGVKVMADGELRELLASMLEAYVKGGERELRADKLGQYIIARYGSVREGKERLGLEVNTVRDIYHKLQTHLYEG